MTWLSGKKTYILAGLAAVDALIYALKGLGLPALQGIPDGVMVAFAGFIGAGSFATMRAAIDKLEK